MFWIIFLFLLLFFFICAAIKKIKKCLSESFIFSPCQVLITKTTALARVSIPETYRIKSMPSVAGRRQCYCWVVPGKCWYSVLNLIFQSVLRHPSAAFFSRACFWCALTGLLSFLRVIYELITSSTYDVYMNVVFSQQCNCSSSLLLGAFGLISLRLVSGIYLSKVVSLSSQSARVLCWYVFNVSVAFIR